MYKKRMAKLPLETSLINPVTRIEDLDYIEVPFSEYSPSILPPLPVGVWHNGELLTTYEINPAIAYSLDGSYDYSQSLQAIENRNITDEKIRISSFAKWLGGIPDPKSPKKLEPVLLSIGGIALKDLAVAQSKSVEDLITSLAYKDVAVIAMAIRLIVYEGDTGYAVEQRCGLEGCPLGKRDTIKLQANFNELVIRYPRQPPQSPSYTVKLATGIKYKETRLESIDLGYAKLHQVSRMMAIKGNGKAETTEMLDLLTTGIEGLPEFADLRRTKRLPEIFSIMSIKDSQIVTAAFDLMDKTGCNTQLNPVCSCFKEESIPIGFAWMRWSGIYGVQPQ